MGCVNTGSETICEPPYDPMIPADLTEDIVCGTSSIVLILVGLGIGWLAADKFASYYKGR